MRTRIALFAGAFILLSCCQKPKPQGTEPPMEKDTREALAPGTARITCIIKNLKSDARFYRCAAEVTRLHGAGTAPPPISEGEEISVIIRRSTAETMEGGADERLRPGETLTLLIRPGQAGLGEEGRTGWIVIKIAP